MFNVALMLFYVSIVTNNLFNNCTDQVVYCAFSANKFHHIKLLVVVVAVVEQKFDECSLFMYNKLTWS